MKIRFVDRKKVQKIISLIGVGALAFTLAGCTSQELSHHVTYDTIDTNDSSIEHVVQELDVPGENFKLYVNYNCRLENGRKWTITDNKLLEMEIYTSPLEEGTEVYIDNIHSDTSIICYTKKNDGVLQDTMDDRIHNSIAVGFPISDKITYYGINEIEGQNDTFIRGYGYTYHGTGSTTVEERRRLESEYLADGVYGNKIDSVIDLLIHKKGMEDGVYRAVSIPSTLAVRCCNYVQILESDGSITYQVYYVDNNGQVQKDITRQEPQSNIPYGRNY